jgi:lysylphosphatidylglycerol synthetase-like protein (DUF2156 family)
MLSVAALAVVDTAMIMLVGKRSQQNRTEWNRTEAVGMCQEMSSELYYAPRTVPCSSTAR